MYYKKVHYHEPYKDREIEICQSCLISTSLFTPTLIVIDTDMFNS